MKKTRIRYTYIFLLFLPSLLSAFVAAQETVVSFRNIPYVKDGGERQQLDLFLPIGYETAEKPFPILIQIHGGGWGGGSKGDALGLARRMVSHGIAVAAINYRLLPDNKMPAQIVDCKAALRWLRAHAEKYHLDKKHFAVTGHSAGGHLCAALGTLGETREFDQGDYLDESSAVQAVVDLCGPSDLETYIKGSTNHFFGVEREDALARNLLRKMSPARMVTKNTAPMMILHAPDDTLVLLEQSEKLHDVLKKQGIPVEMIVTAPDTGGHGADEFGVEKTQRRILSFLKKYLDPPETTKEIKEILKVRDEQRVNNLKHWGITPNPKLPNILLLGDTVAIGYLTPVRKALKDKANVYFPLNEDNGPEDCRYVRYSLVNLDDYLGKIKWDVIHFNWGHQDLVRHKDGRADAEGKPRYPIEDYEKYLDRMVGELKKTGAKLIWASSTKIPPGVNGLREGDEVEYNAVAEKVMKKHGIPVDDLYVATKSLRPDRFLMPGHTRLSNEESEKIAPAIVECLSEMLPGQRTEKAVPGAKYLREAAPPKEYVQRPVAKFLLSPPSPEHRDGTPLRSLAAYPEQWAELRKHTDAILYADHNLHWQFKKDDGNGKLMDDDEGLTELLKNLDIPFQLEVGAVKPWGRTGAEAFEKQYRQWERFLKCGMKIDGIAMDEPLNCCLFHIEKDMEYAATETAEFIALVHKHYPEWQVGDIEGFPSVTPDQAIKWLDLLQKKLKEKGERGLDFFRLDVDWMHFVHNTGRGSWADVRRIEHICRQRKIPFSLVYWAADYPSMKNRNMADDKTWYIGTMQMGYDYVAVGGKPDQFVVQSWVGGPPTIIPESNPFSFTRSALDIAERIMNRPPEPPPALKK